MASGLDFLIPGVGHIYASGGEEGWGLLISNILLAITVPFIYVTILGNFIIWIYAMATVGGVVHRHNGKIRATLNQERVRQITDALHVRGAQVAEEIWKLVSLRKMHVLTEEEFRIQRDALVESLFGRRTTESLGEFFLPLAPLVNSGDLGPDDLDRLKRIHASIRVLD